MRFSARLLFWPAVLMLLSAALVALPARAATITIPQTVTATIETEPVPHSGDSADDPAIWIHPTDPSQSTIIGTDKHGGLAVYDLSGTQLQYLPDGDLNNVARTVRDFEAAGAAGLLLEAAHTRALWSVARSAHPRVISGACA
jgi:3-phytase